MIEVPSQPKSEIATLQSKTLWDSCLDPNTQTIELDIKTLHDFQRLVDGQSSDSQGLDRWIVQLLNFYQDADNLNLILLPNVIENRDSYKRYPYQLAQKLRWGQKVYKHIKVQFDAGSNKVGIFCRKNSFESRSWIANLIATLQKVQEIQIDFEDLPATYRYNFAMLGKQIRDRLPQYDVVVRQELVKGLFSQNDVGKDLTSHVIVKISIDNK